MELANLFQAATGGISNTAINVTAIAAALTVNMILIRFVIGQVSKSMELISKNVLNCTLLVGELYKLLLIHDSTIRGINPTAGATQGERDTLGAQEYRKLQSSLETVTEKIRSQT